MITSTLQNEFWFHVADQNEIPIAGKVDKNINLVKLETFLTNFPSSKIDLQKDYLAQHLLVDPDLIDILRTLVGISDKRMYLELSYLFSKTKYNSEDKINILNDSFYNLNKHPLSYYKNLLKNKNDRLKTKSMNIISDYLVNKDVFNIINIFKKISTNELEIIIKKLIITKEEQQAEAKRRGHGAEFELAKLLNKIGCLMIPNERHTKPIGFKDPNVNRETFEICKKEKGETWSFDLIITKNNENIIFIQSLIHTSDPGQYGVNKSDETVQIKNDLKKHNRTYNTTKELWGLVDGVGFCENKKDTINKMLNEFDCFLQLKTLYKAPLRLHKLNLINVKAIYFDLCFYTIEEAKLMYEKYCSDDIVFLDKDNFNSPNKIKVGKAIIYI